MDNQEPINATTKFNGAQYQLRRMNNLQEKMHEYRCSPFDKGNPNSSLLNFQTHRSLLDGLFLEISSKLKPEEDKSVTAEQLKLTNAINILFKVRTDFWGKNPQLTQNVLTAMFNYEKELLKCIETHGMGNPDEEDDYGDDF